MHKISRQHHFHKKKNIHETDDRVGFVECSWFAFPLNAHLMCRDMPDVLDICTHGYDCVHNCKRKCIGKCPPARKNTISVQQQQKQHKQMYKTK